MDSLFWICRAISVFLFYQINMTDMYPVDRHIEKKNQLPVFQIQFDIFQIRSFISHLINCIAYNSWNNPIHCSVYIIFKIVKPLGIFWFWILILIKQKQTNKQLVYKKKTFCISLLAFTYIFFLMEPPFHCICSMCKVICPLQHLSWGIFRKKFFFFLLPFWSRL